MNQPEEFGITREGIQAILRKTFTKLFPVMLIAALAGITIPMIQEMESSKKENFDLFDLIPFFIVGGFMTISIFRTKKRLENIYRGYTVIFQNDTITRSAPSMTTITLPYHEIKHIKKGTDGSFAIVGKSRFNSILIPAPIENRDRIEVLLRSIPSVSIEEKKSLIAKLIVPLILAVLGLFAVFVLSNNKVVIFSIGIVLSAGMIYSFFIVRKSKMYDQRSKNGSWLSLFIAITILASTYLRVFY